MISFLVTTNKERYHNINGCIDNIRAGFPDAEIIILNQIDDRAFKKGQLYNIGVKFANHNNLVFMDNDFRFTSKSYIDFDRIFDTFPTLETAMLPFNVIIQVKELESNKFECIDNGDMICKGAGGIFLMTKEVYGKACGHSNLYFGYGYEDLSFPIRVGQTFMRMSGYMAHVRHDNDHGVYMKQQMFQENERLWKTEGVRINYRDSWNHTTAEWKKVDKGTNVIELQIKNIGVSDDFGYPELYNQQIENERKQLCLEQV